MTETRRRSNRAHPPAERPKHASLAAALLMIGVVVFLVAVSVLTVR